jgi:hypothetical protein
MSSSRNLAVAAVLTLGLGALGAGQAPTGDLWETTSQMSMEGSPIQLPSNTAKVCAAKNWSQPPNSQKNCKSSNMMVEGAKVTWDVQCTGPSMTGHGEITREGADAYKGLIKFTGDQGNMTIKISGRKLGECDKPQ